MKTNHKFIVMETLLYINADFETVFMINGVFTESSVIACDADDVLYITVLPLNPLHLPYTVKTVAGKILNDTPLAKSFKTSKGVALKLSPRFNYVYTAAEHCRPGDIAELFFEYVKQKNFAKARTLMTPELGDALNDESLFEFFAPYNELVKCGDGYFMINADDEGEEYIFELKNKRIDNIRSAD